jgi:Flp pilus assembly protein TadD
VNQRRARDVVGRTGSRFGRAAAALGIAVVAVLVVVAIGPFDRQARLRRLDLEALRRAARAHPNDAELFLELGKRLRQSGELRAATVMSRRAYDLSKGEPRFAAALVGAILDSGDIDEAHRMAKASLSHWQDSGELRAQLARTYASRGHFTDALREAREAVRLAPRHAEAWQAFGNACTANKRVEEAFIAFEHARELERGDAEVLIDYGAALARYGRTAQAEAVLQQARGLAPRGARAAAALGQLKASRARTREERAAARELLREALSRAPADADTVYNLALLEEQDGHLHGAIRLLKACLKVDPRYGESHLALGHIYQRLRRSSDARQEITAWQRFSDYRRQAAHLELRLRRQPEDARLLHRLMTLHSKQGNREHEERYRRQLLALKGNR